MAAWDRLPDETEEAYARFLIYRGLGPLRTLTNAESVACGRKKKHASGNWTRDHSVHEWRSRAIAWDITQLQANGERLGYVFIGVLEKMTEQLAEALVAGKAKPKSARDVAEWFKTLSPYLTPQLIDKIRAKPSGPDHLPGATDGEPGSSE